MPDSTSKLIFLGDNHFEFVTQKTGWTKAQYRSMDSGDADDYPLYTAAQNPVAHISKSHIVPIQAEPENPIISFGANGDGSAGTNFVFHVKPFYVSNDRTCFKIVNKAIAPFYVYYKLQTIKSEYGFDFNYKATPKNASLVSVEIPLKTNGEFDIEAQEKSVVLFKKHQRTQIMVAEQRERIGSALVALSSSFQFQDELLDNKTLFELAVGKRLLKRQVVRWNTRL